MGKSVWGSPSDRTRAGSAPRRVPSSCRHTQRSMSSPCTTKFCIPSLCIPSEGIKKAVGKQLLFGCARHVHETVLVLGAFGAHQGQEKAPGGSCSLLPASKQQLMFLAVLSWERQRPVCGFPSEFCLIAAVQKNPFPPPPPPPLANLRTYPSFLQLAGGGKQGGDADVHPRQLGCVGSHVPQRGAGDTDGTLSVFLPPWAAVETWLGRAWGAGPGRDLPPRERGLCPSVHSLQSHFPEISLNVLGGAHVR